MAAADVRTVKVKTTLHTLKTWNFREIGYDTYVSKDKTWIKTVWCDVCRCQGVKIKADPRIRGAAANNQISLQND